MTFFNTFELEQLFHAKKDADGRAEDEERRSRGLGFDESEVLRRGWIEYDVAMRERGFEKEFIRRGREEHPDEYLRAHRAADHASQLLLQGQDASEIYEEKMNRHGFYQDYVKRKII